MIDRVSRPGSGPRLVGWCRVAGGLGLAMALAPLGTALPAIAAAPRAPAHVTSGVASPRPACAASASCAYHVAGSAADYPTHGQFARLHVDNGPPGQPASAEIDYDLYIPDVATPTTPQPAIMYFNGFGGAKDDSSGTALGKFFAQHGYVYLAFSSEGFGHSGGHIELDSPEYDVKNARALVDLLGQEPYVLKDDGPAHDPRVGLTGGSYGGAIQLLTAEFDPRVDAITPFRTWNTLDYALAPNNLQSNYLPQTLNPGGVIKTEWTSLFFVDGLIQPFSGNGSGVPGTFVNPQPQPCPAYDHRLCQLYLETVATNQASGSTRQVLQNSSPASFFNGGVGFFDPTMVSHGLNVPTLLGQGELDTLFNLNDAIANYRSVQARGVPVKMLWHSNGHGYDDLPGEDDVFGGDATNPNRNYIPQRLLAWFDRYLRLDASVDTGPNFSYFRDWVPYDHRGSAAPAYGTASAFPFEPNLTFTLSGTADLALPGQPATPGTARFVNPPGGVPSSYTETSNFQCSTCALPVPGPNPFPGMPPSNPPCVAVTCEYVDFTSKPFANDVISVGAPTAHLHLSAVPGQDIVMYGKVFDVAADGSAELVKRLIAPVRVSDTSRPVDVNLVAFAHRFAAGHAVRFELAATDMTSGNSRVPDLISVVSGAATDPSTFTLPVDAAANAAPAPVVPSFTGRGLPPTSAVRPASLLPGFALLLVAALLVVGGATSRLRRHQ
ncbi:MAG: hypothetical protein M3010_03160 [Candidatus Dormibacteraeota bacterium]|nr:hypothetical protein [Candidatus Dormibacteraeota bacterium]